LALPSSRIAVTTDFDNTIITSNAAVVLSAHYLLHGNGNFLSRLRKVMVLCTRRLRRTHMNIYYEVLHSMTEEERARVLARIPVSTAWLDVIKDLRFEYEAREVDLTILSRNCLDVIKEWVHVHKDALEKHHIHVVTIIANRPLCDVKYEYVKEQYHHIDRAGYGLLHMDGKKRFVDDKTVYVGDSGEEVLRGYVGEFVRV
jgi:hypothetical protein